MRHQQFHPRSSNLALVLGGLAALAVLSCGDTPKRPPASTGGAGGGVGGSSGGTSGSGGSGSGGASSGTGGTNASGGDTGSGGSGSGGSGAGGDTGSGGAGGGGGSGDGGAGGSGGGGMSAGGSGSGGTTTPPKSCASNDDCSDDRPLCETSLKLCAQCLQSSDCQGGGHCLGNACVSFTPCGNSRDCGNDEVCDQSRGVCVECVQPADCTDGRTCVQYECVTASTCASNDDCGGKLCDTDRKVCVDCLGDGDCAADTEHCVQSACRPACASDKQCTPQGMLCDTTSSVCVQCMVDADCPASAYCAAGACKPDTCDQAMSACVGGGVAACNGSGSGWATASSCGDKDCIASGGVASCGGSPPPDGGPPPVDGGEPQADAPPSDDAPGTCNTAALDPCTGIVAFGGDQTVDGKDTDFCAVPTFTFGVDNAKVNNNYNNIPNSQFEVVAARFAWSSAGLHAFFDVTDASVQTVNMKDPGQAVDKVYQGDSIELFVSASDSLTGLTGSDGNAMHVILPANGPAVVVQTTNNGGVSVTHTALPTEQYAQAVTDKGYVIEVKLPWPGGNAPSAGGHIRFDIALNSADTICSGVDDMRDAQLVYTVGAVSGQSTCPGAPDAWCDDRTWCDTALQ
jgi:hypothetical protein